MKILRVVIRNIRDALRSVFRNISLSFASITCSSITLLLVAIALVITFNVRYLTKQYANELTIVTYIHHDATEDDLKTFENHLNDIKNIDSYTYKSKEDWKKETQDESEYLNKALEYLSYNPLLDSYTVKVKDISKMKEISNKIEESNIVESVDYNEGLVEKVVVLFDVINNVSIILVIALLLVTAFLIGNTIKLTIFSRRTEIEIMRLVGTSNTVIKLPFVFEGLILGIMGAILPILITVYGYMILYDRLDGHLFNNLIKLVEPYPSILMISIFVLLLGSIIGVIGSLRAVRKYLKI